MRRAAMKKVSLFVCAFALLGAGGDLSTERRVHGVITSIDPANLTIASSQHAVTGKIDPARTRVTVNGHPAKLADLKLTAHAKGDLCLDDVWLTIDTH
jgi:hypothetical protein